MTEAEWIEAWRLGVANALGDVPVDARLERGVLELSAHWKAGEETMVAVVPVNLDAADPEPYLFEMAAEELHAVGYPRP